MPGRVDGKQAIVIGAGSIGPGWGNGKAAAVLYAREGATVVAVDVNAEAAQETASIIQGEGGTCHVVPCDVTDGAAVEAMVAAAVEACGRIDILHNNVGVVTMGGPEDLSEAEWDRACDINLKSMFLTCKHTLPVMTAQTPNAVGQRGAIVNISSVAAIRHSGIDYISYATTKGANLPLTRSIAIEYAPKGIRANSVLPGLMDTPLVYHSLAESLADGDAEKMREMRAEPVPLGHMGDAWDVAYASLYLASDEAKYVTATELVVDGGVIAKFM
jgi:NAD(P)-dependent dehydrogenase (short-subunit alcohol dehydrogenase family)